MTRNKNLKGKNRKTVRAMTLVDWLVDEEEILARAEEALAEIEKEELLSNIRSGLFQEPVKSVPVEQVAGKIGVSPLRLLKLVGERQRQLDYQRIRCPSSSKYGWCLRHKGEVEKGLAKFYPSLIEALERLKAIKLKIQDCLESPPRYVIDLGIPYICRIASREELTKLVLEAQMLAEELGIPEEVMPRLRSWLRLDQRLRLADGTIIEETIA